MIKVLFICHGNICRSTMAESVFTHMVKEKHLSNLFEINSAATHRDEIGNPPHYGTVNKLHQEGIAVVPHRAVQMTKEDYQYYDYLIGMDDENMIFMRQIAIGDKDHKIYKMLSFAGKTRDVADPWFTGNFEVTYDDIVEGLNGFLDFLKKEGKL